MISSQQRRYNPTMQYNCMVLRSVEENTPYNADQFAQADIERPSLNGRMVEVVHKEPLASD